MSVWWRIMTVFESLLVVYSFFCSLLFVYLILTSRRLHQFCRIYLLLVGFSMIIFASYGLSIFEYLNVGKQYALSDDATFRSKIWEFIHEFGVCLQSLSMLLFSAERYITNEHPKFQESFTFVICIYVSVIISVVLALAFSSAIHFYEQLIIPTSFMSLSDWLGLVILVSAWRSSLQNYSLSTGKTSLERRYKMSEVYEWTSTLLPAIGGASIFKVLSMVPIWIWLILELDDWQYGIANFLYNNILNTYVVIFPWILIYRNKNIKQKIFAKRKIAPGCETVQKSIKTLEGKEISMRPTQGEYFDALQVSWKI